MNIWVLMMRIHQWSNYDFSSIRDAIVISSRKARRKRKYLDIITAFDIEAYNNTKIENAIMYIWMYAIGDDVIIGRTWEEFKYFIKKLNENIGYGAHLLTFIHNASYEFQFLKGIYNIDNCFATDLRKVLSFDIEKIEFRCSYFLTNMSLAEFTKKMGVDNEKLSGDEFDYKKERYFFTPLTDKELAYCVNDVLGLVQAIRKQLELYGDTLATMPLTSTGYVRRDVKKALGYYSKKILPELLPPYEIFVLLREAFRGGDTHANRYYAGQILDNVYSYDRVSSYPAEMINRNYPAGKWIKLEGYDALIEKIYIRKRACLFRAGFKNIRLKNRYDGCPYIPVHKCRNRRNIKNDNGRILEAEEIEITLTDVDFRIISNQYIWDEIIINDFYTTRYAPLPKPLKDVILEYFKGKTELKGIDDFLYMKSKNLLNAVYGMSVQSPVKQSIKFDGILFETMKEDEEKLLYENYKKAFLLYSTGVWVTCYAREELRKGIELAGYDDFVYADTDSVKTLKKIDFREYNKNQRGLAQKNGGKARDKNNKWSYLGFYEYEGKYDKFITYGAKKYAYIKDGKTGITIAGVNKRKGGEELIEKGGIEALKPGFIFEKAGGTESKYNDFMYDSILEKDGYKILVTPNLYICDSTYTLGLTEEYISILEHAITMKKVLERIEQNGN